MPHVPLRREGFTGQHLVVLPASVREQARRHPLLSGLLVTDAGYFPKAAGHQAWRPQGATTHLLIVCLHGHGWVRGSGRTQRVGPGDLVWVSADVPHGYGADEDNPWTIVWAHFTGAEIAHWQRESGWAQERSIGVFSAGIEGATLLALDRVYARLEMGYSLQHLLAAAAALRQGLCAMIDLKHRGGANRTAQTRTAAVRDEMIANLPGRHRLGELATAAGLSVPHFCLLFRRLTGYPPIDFLNRERIRRACRLLDSTDTSIATIAVEVGFPDPYYFSRRFREVMGMSPREYRKVLKA